MKWNVNDLMKLIWWNWFDEIDLMKLIWWNWFDEIDLMKLIWWNWFDKTSCDHEAKSFSFLFFIVLLLFYDYSIRQNKKLHRYIYSFFGDNRETLHRYIFKKINSLDWRNLQIAMGSSVEVLGLLLYDESAVEITFAPFTSDIRTIVGIWIWGIRGTGGE